MQALKALWALVSFKAKRDAKNKAIRRAKYEALKTKIAERHYQGGVSLAIDFPGTYDATDLACFRWPMYSFVRTPNDLWAISWNRQLMVEEIGLRPIPVEASNGSTTQAV